MNKFLFLIIVIVVAIVACNDKNNMNSFSIGDDFVNTATNVAIIDTYSVRMSTVIRDSLETSKKNVLLAGNFYDEYFGGVSSETYVEFSLPEEFGSGGNLLLDSFTYFDSLTLNLKYSDLVYGDTLKEQTFEVYQLDEELMLHDLDGQLYNSSSFKHKDELLGSVTLKPRPRQGFHI